MNVSFRNGRRLWSYWGEVSHQTAGVAYRFFQKLQSGSLTMGDDNSASLHHIRGAATAVTHRWLITTPQEDELSNDVGVEQISSSSGNRPDATTIYLILLSVLVGMVCLFYAGCLYAIVRDWVRYRCCGGEPPQQEPEDGATDTVVVHEGRVFSVVGDQRRAVLEAIFKETSKVSAVSV